MAPQQCPKMKCMFRWMMVNAILLIKQLAFFKKLPHCDSRTSTQGSTPPPSLWHLYLNLRLRALKTWQEFQVKAAQYNPIMYIIYPLSSIYLSICLSVYMYIYAHIRACIYIYLYDLIRTYTMDLFLQTGLHSHFDRMAIQGYWGWHLSHEPPWGWWLAQSLQKVPQRRWLEWLKQNIA